MLNLAHSPDKDEGFRYQQFVGAPTFMTEKYEAGNFPLFQARAGKLAQEMRPEYDGDGSVHSLWEFIKMKIPTSTIGRRCKMGE